MEKDESIIPEGLYCYTGHGKTFICCPYWSKRIDKPEQENGYCSFLEHGDWMYGDGSGISLLWDQVKECGVNEGDWEKECTKL